MLVPKRILILGIAVVAGAALSGIRTPSASADICYLSFLKEGPYLSFNNINECGGVLVSFDMWWFYLAGLGKQIKGTEYCSEVHAGQKGKYTNAECTTEGEGKFLKVKLQLPDIMPGLEGEKYPVSIKGTLSTALFTLEASKQKLTGEGDTVTLEAPETNATGTFAATYTHVAFEGKKCNTSGAKEGEVKSSGSYQVVRLSKTSSAIGLLFLPSEYVVECGTTKIKVKGSMIANLSAGEENTELTSMELTLSGSKGKEEVTKYLNYSEEEVTVHPEANFGSGFVEADEAIGSKVNLVVSMGNMFKILGR